MNIYPWSQMRFCVFKMTTLLTLAFVGIACQLPNVAPFLTSTSDLRAAAVGAGDAVAETMKLDPRVIRGDLQDVLGSTQQELAAERQRFRAEWTARIRALDGAVRYAQSLSAIVSAGSNSKESVAQVADSVESLAKAADIALPAAGTAAAGAVEVGKLIGAALIDMKSAKSVAEAIDKAQPAIDSIGEKLMHDVTDLEAILENAIELQRVAATLGYSDELRFRRSVIETRLDLYSNADVLSPSYTEAIKRVDEHLDSMDEWHDDYEAIQRNIDLTGGANRAILSKLKQGILAWTDANRNLLMAVEQNSQISVTAVSEAAVRIRDLIQTIEEGKDAS